MPEINATILVASLSVWIVATLWIQQNDIRRGLRDGTIELVTDGPSAWYRRKVRA